MEEKDFDAGLRLLLDNFQAKKGESPISDEELAEISNAYRGREAEAFKNIFSAMGQDLSDEEVNEIVVAYPRVEKKNQIGITDEEEPTSTSASQQEATSTTPSGGPASGSGEFLENQASAGETQTQEPTGDDIAPEEEERGYVDRIIDFGAKIAARVSFKNPLLKKEAEKRLKEASEYDRKAEDAEIAERRQAVAEKQKLGEPITSFDQRYLKTVDETIERITPPDESVTSFGKGVEGRNYYKNLGLLLSDHTSNEKVEIITKLAERGDFDVFAEKKDQEWYNWIGEMLGSQAGAILTGMVSGAAAPLTAGTAQAKQAETQSLVGYVQAFKDQGLEDDEVAKKATAMAEISRDNAFIEGALGSVGPGGLFKAGAGITQKVMAAAVDAGMDATAAGLLQMFENKIAIDEGLKTELMDGVVENAAGELAFSVIMNAFGLGSSKMKSYLGKLKNRDDVSTEVKNKVDQEMEKQGFVPKSKLTEQESARIAELNEQADKAIAEGDSKAAEDAVSEANFIKQQAEQRKGANITDAEQKQLDDLEKKKKQLLMKGDTESVKAAKKVQRQIDTIKDEAAMRPEITPEQKAGEEPVTESKVKQEQTRVEKEKEAEAPKEKFIDRKKRGVKIIDDATNKINDLQPKIDELAAKENQTPSDKKRLAAMRKQQKELKANRAAESKFQKQGLKPKTIEDAVENAREFDEGASFDPKTGEVKQFKEGENYVVGVSGEKVSKKDLSTDRMNEFQEKNKGRIDQQAKKGNKLITGISPTPDGNSATMEVGMVFKSKEKAIEFARKNGQDVIWDTRTQKYINTETGETFSKFDPVQKKKKIDDQGETKEVEGLDPNKRVIDSFETSDGVVYVQRDGDQYLIIPDKPDGETSKMRFAEQILNSTDPKFKELKAKIKENIEAWEKGTHATGEYINDVANESTDTIEKRIKDRDKRTSGAKSREKVFRDLESARDAVDKMTLYNRYFEEGDMEKAEYWRRQASMMFSNAGTMLNVAKQMTDTTPQGLFNSVVKGIEDTGRKLTKADRDSLKAMVDDLIKTNKEIDKIGDDLATKKGVTAERVVGQLLKLNAKSENLELKIRNLGNRQIKRSRVGLFTSQMIGSMFAIPSLLGNIAGNRYQQLARNISGKIADTIIVARRLVLRAVGKDDGRRLTDGTMFGKSGTGLRGFIARNKDAIIKAYTTGAPIGENRFRLDTQLRAWDNMMTVAAAAVSKMKGEAKSKKFWELVWSDPAIPKDENGRVTTTTKAKFLAEMAISIIPDFALRSLLVGDLSFRTEAKQKELIRSMSQYGTKPVKNFADAQAEFLKLEAQARQKRNKAVKAETNKEAADLTRSARNDERKIKEIVQRIRNASDESVFTKDAPITKIAMRFVNAMDQVLERKSGDTDWWKKSGVDQKAYALGKEVTNALFKIFRAINLPFPRIPANIGAAAFDIVFPIAPAAKVAWGTKVGDQQMIQDGLSKIMAHFALTAMMNALPGLVWFVDKEEAREMSVKDSAMARARNGSINTSRIRRWITGQDTSNIEEPGDVWISLQRIGPIGAALLMMGASEWIGDKARLTDEGEIARPLDVTLGKMTKSVGVAAMEQPTLTGMANSFAMATGESSSYHAQNMLRTVSTVFSPAILRNMFIKGVDDSEAVNKRDMEFTDRWLNDMFTDNVLFHYGDKWLGDKDWAYATPEMIAEDKNKVQKMNLPHLNLRGDLADPTQSKTLQWLSSNIDVFNSNRSEATKLDIELIDVMRNLPADYEGAPYSDPRNTMEWVGVNGKKVKVNLMRGDHWEMVRMARRMKAIRMDILVGSDSWGELSYKDKADLMKEQNQDVNDEVREIFNARLQLMDINSGITKKPGAWKDEGAEYEYR